MCLKFLLETALFLLINSLLKVEDHLLLLHGVSIMLLLCYAHGWVLLGHEVRVAGLVIEKQ